MSNADIRHYRARTLQEAFQMVRRELGAEASVLESRQVWDGMWRGLLGHRCFEVVAAQGKMLVPVAAGDTFCDTEKGVGTPTEDIRGILRENLLRFSSGSRDLSAWGATLATPAGAAPVSDAVVAVFSELLELGYPEDLARELTQTSVRQLDIKQELHRDTVWGALRIHLANQIGIQGAIRLRDTGPTVVALVGATGVGKTTTIAKLAAEFRLRDKVHVGLVTIDTYRMAAFDQLRSYAEIIDLPMEVVGSAREMRSARQRLAQCDLILMDTAGCNPQAESNISEMKATLAAAGVHETHLVLSATMSSAILSRTIDRFQETGVHSVILSKADEALGLGAFFAAMHNRGLPVSYVTHGQSVPDDISVATRGLMHDLLLQSAWETP